MKQNFENEGKRVGDAAAYLGVSVPHLYRMIHAGEVPAMKLGNRYIIIWPKFLDWVNQQSGGNAV